MKFSGSLNYNSIFWISSLNSEECGPTRRILEDLTVQCKMAELPLQIYSVESASLLLDVLATIEEAAIEGLQPLIHFDMHGSKDQGLRVAASNENVDWDTVVKHLRAINIATKNNLCVVSGVCFGFQAIREVTMSEACPFYMLIAPENEINVGFLEDHIGSFYTEMISSNDIMNSYEIHLAKKIRVFHCEKVLASALANYVRSSCRGKGKNERKEFLITELLNQGIEKTPENLRNIRSQVKSGINPTKELVDCYTDRFLIGKSSGFTFDELMEEVE